MAHPWFSLKFKEENKENPKVDPTIITSIMGFHSASKLKREALRVIVNQLPENQIQSLKEKFRAIDKKNTGVITLKELYDTLKIFGKKINFFLITYF